MRLNVYIDGFNFYYRCLKKTPFKWLDYRAFLEASFPGHQIATIRYFTALVSAREPDPGQATRQQVYLRALRTLPDFVIHEGQFLAKPTWMPLDPLPRDRQIEVRFPPGTSGEEGTKALVPFDDFSSAPCILVRVRRDEEKGSDVNLATYLLRDAFRDECEGAVLLSNDSDLCEPLSLLRREFRRKTFVLFPPKGKANKELLRAIGLDRGGSEPFRVDPDLLRAHQFPARLTDAHGVITKPEAWDVPDQESP